MQRRLIDPDYLHAVRSAYMDASSPWERREIIQEAIERTGYSRTGLYRVLALNIWKKTPSEHAQSRQSIIDQYAKIVWDHKRDHSKGVRKINMAPCYRHLVKKGIIPSDITYHQIAASIRRQHFKQKMIPLFRRFERSDALSLVQVDFTRSAYITIVPKGKKKNSVKLAYSKGANGSMSRVWVGMMIDDASRVVYGKYYIASGESASLAQKFMLESFSEKSTVDKTTGEIIHHKLFQGTPEQVYTDKGSGFCNALVNKGLSRMGITHVIGGNEKDSEGNALRSSNKQARGKVERMMQPLKDDFEITLMFEYGEGAVFTLDEINEMFHKWLMNNHNRNAHPTREKVTRWDVFEKALASIKYPKEDAGSLFYTATWRTVIRGQVCVEPGIWCKVPYSVAKGQRIVIITEADTYYTMIDNKRIALEVISDKKHDVMKPLAPKQEQDRDNLHGIALRSRLSKEIEKLTNYMHNIGSLPESLNDDIAEFLVTPRSIREIKECAKGIVARAQETSPMSIAPSGELINNTGE